jgi:hypothetical protein
VINTDQRTSQALDLMLGFAQATGLDDERAAQDRYLWTDAFAVCNFLALGETELALQLVDQVHRTLGRHSRSDVREGWISGLDGAQAEAHPTRGGLRIGKQRPERAAGEPLEERLEWERDGQYFHYLTKWMHALDQVARWTGQARFNIWARELAEAVFRAFTYVPRDAPSSGRRMYWKLSVDLSRPLVASMGHHDPLDGYVTFRQLQASAIRLGVGGSGPPLDVEAAEFAAMIPFNLTTEDPLGLGALLADAWRVEQLMGDGGIAGPALRDRLLDAALIGLGNYDDEMSLKLPSSYRLAFRELGLAIGLAAVPNMSAADGAHRQLERVARFAPLRFDIEAFWLRPNNRSNAIWLEHQNINEVMLATSLVPEGYLTLRGLQPARA